MAKCDDIVAANADGAGCGKGWNISICFACQLFVVTECCYRSKPQLNKKMKSLPTGSSASLTENETEIWPVLFEPAQCQRPPL